MEELHSKSADQKERSRGPEEQDKQNNELEIVIPRHEKLWVWQKAHQLMLIIFHLCQKLPSSERFRLGDQIQRSSCSVPDNIAEGCSSYYFNDKIKCYRISRKEAAETQSHLREMTAKLYLPENDGNELISRYEEVIRGLNGLINKTCELRELYDRKGIKRI